MLKGRSELRIHGLLLQVGTLLLVLATAACHGRPLRAQLDASRARESAARDPSGPSRALRGVLGARLNERQDEPGIFRLTTEDLQPVRDALALRRHRTRDLARGSCVLREAEAMGRRMHGTSSPAKAHRPGSVDVDVPRLVRFFTKLLGR